MTQRPIKFRAWDKYSKSMGMIDCLYGFENAGIHGPNCPDLPDRDEVMLMQFTGLQDKHGTPIFEGDVIETFNPILLERGENSDIRGVVKYREDQGYFFLEVEGSFYTLMGRLEAPQVIGNVFENGDLLDVAT